MLDLIIIIASVVYIYNHSGFMFDLSKGIYKIINPTKPYLGQPLMKPFGCALCMVFWLTVIYSFFSLGLPIIKSIGIGVASSLISLVIDKILMGAIRIINKI